MKISFPGIGLQLFVSKVAFQIFHIEIYWYAIFIVLAMIIGLVILKKKNGLFGIQFLDILDLSIYLIPIAFLCARIYYVVFQFDYYMLHPMQIFNIRDGGLAIYGGIIGGFLTSYFYCRIKKIHLLDLLDYIAPCLALRSGNWKMGKFF